MATVCVFGSDPSVGFRLIWNDGKLPNALLQALKDWIDLPEVQLQPLDSLIKISRHTHGATTYTWIGFYALPKGFEPGRANSFLGAGLLLRGDETVLGGDAYQLIDDVSTMFINAWVGAHEGQERPPLAQVELPTLPPESHAAMVGSTYHRTGNGGLSDRAGSDDTLFIDIADTVYPGQIAFYIDWAQVGWRFADYHTALIGRAPLPDHQLKTITVADHRDFLAQPPPAAPPTPVAPAPSPSQVDDPYPADDPWTGTQQFAGTGGGGVVGSHGTPLPAIQTTARDGNFDRGFVRGALVTMAFVIIAGLLIFGTLRLLNPSARTEGDTVVAAPTPAPTPAPSVEEPLAPDSTEAISAIAFVKDYFGKLKANQMTSALKLWDKKPVVEPTRMRDFNESLDLNATVADAQRSQGQIAVRVRMTLGGQIAGEGFVYLMPSGASWKITSDNIPPQVNLIALAQAESGDVTR